jgi:hypothetical protein
MDPEDLALVCTVQNPTEAEMIHNALKAVGIASVIGGEGQAGFSGIFKIDILAHASDVDAAKKYLRKLRREKAARKKKRRAAREAKAAGPSEAIQAKPSRKKPQ